MAEKKKSSAAKIVSGAYYQLISKQSGKALETAADGSVYMSAPADGDNQRFAFEEVDGCYKIVCKESGRVLDIILAGTDNGAQIHQWDVTGADNQLWVVEPATNGYVAIKSKLSGRCLDIVGMSMEVGARVQIWDDMQGDNQQWMLEKATANTASAAKKAPKAAPAVKKEFVKAPAAEKTAKATAAKKAAVAKEKAPVKKPAAKKAAPKKEN